MIRLTLGMAFREIRRNTLRSFLTMLGIVIGVGAVIALVTIGKGASAKVAADVGKLGNRLLILSPGGLRRSSGYAPAPAFKAEDVAAIRSDIAGIDKVAPSVTRQGLLVYGNRNWRTSITGSTSDYLEVRSYEIERGRPISEEEMEEARPFCVVGATVVRELFGGDDPLGASMRVDRVTCEVVGVLKAKGQSGVGQDQDDMVLLPLVTVQRRLAGSNDVNAIYISVAPLRDTAVVRERLEDLLRERRRIVPGNPDDFGVRDMQEIAQAMTSVTATMTTLLGAIAAVSLLVGGIGIMNIMLVNVTERTREIGIRLAIGAMAYEVLLQFLVEAVVLSTIGGLIGIAAGLGGSYAATQSLGVPFVLVPGILAVAFAFSVAIGVAFGYLPAHKAARLNPIEALRHE